MVSLVKSLRRDDYLSRCDQAEPSERVHLGCMRLKCFRSVLVKNIASLTRIINTLSRTGEAGA